MQVQNLAESVLGGARARGTYRRMRVLDGPQATRMDYKDGHITGLLGG